MSSPPCSMTSNLTHQMMPSWEMFCRQSWTRMMTSIGIFFWMLIAYCVFDAQRMWWHGYAYLLFPEKQFCAHHQEIVSWGVILALTAQLLPSHTRSIGQGCMLTCHILFNLALRVQLPKVAITNALGFHNSLLFLFSHLLVGSWT